jgi:hypothetical protein
MKSTDPFKNTIETWLNNFAEENPNFKVKLESKKKNIDDCITYVLTEVKKSGCNGFADDEVYGMAMHYYDEENIKVGKPVNAKVVVNHTDTSSIGKVYKLNAEELKWIRESLKEEKDKDLIKMFKSDIEELEKNPKKYWDGLDLEGYKSDSEELERYEEVKFMVEHYKAKPKAEIVKSIAPKKAPLKVIKNSEPKQVLPPVKFDRKGQTTLF